MGPFGKRTAGQDIAAQTAAVRAPTPEERIAELEERVTALETNATPKWDFDALVDVLRHAGVCGRTGQEFKVGESVVGVRKDLAQLMEHLGVAFEERPAVRELVDTK